MEAVPRPVGSPLGTTVTISALENTLETDLDRVNGRLRWPRRALVTGATGVLGPVLARSLLVQGWSVLAFCRKSPPANLLPQAVDVRIGDIANADEVAGAFDGVSTVFHLAALLHNPRPGPSETSLYEAVNVGGARNVARAAAHHGASVVHFSTIAVYGATAGEPVDELCPVRPAGPYATTKRRSEEVLLDAGLKVSVLRLAAVYGRRMKGNYPRLVEALRRRRFVAVGDGSNRRTLIHEADAVRAALQAADRVHEVNGIFNVTDGATHSMREILAAICSALGRPEPGLRIPEPLARLAARCIGQGDVVDKYLETVEVKGDRIREVLGFVPKFDLAAGWRDALQPRERE